MSQTLVKYDAAVRALAECVRVDDVKTIRDKAMAMQVYAQQAKDMTLSDQATDIRMRAEIRAGELLAEMKVNGARQKRGGDKKSKSQQVTLIAPPTLADLGITNMQSHRWQKLAALPRADQDAVIAQAKRKAKAASVIRTKSKKRPANDDDDDISRGAVNLALAVRELLSVGLDKIPAKDLPGLLIALRDEMRAIFATIRASIKESSNGHHPKR